MTSRETLIKEIFDCMLVMRLKLIDRQAAIQADCAIPPAQGILLYVVGERESLSVKEIAEIMHISGSAVTQIADNLHKAGLINREADEKDRRTVKISLTDDGKDKFKKIKKFKLESLARMMESLTEQELEHFLNLQRKMMD